MKNKPLPTYARRLKWMLAMLLFCSQVAYAQTLVKGVVKDQSGMPLPGVNVLLKGTSVGVVTDANGSFSISAPSDGTLAFSFIGYSTEEVLVSNQSTINVTLTEDVAALQEVVVVGYGTMKKSDVTGSVASVAPKKLQEIITIDVNSAMQGRVAGVQVVNNSGRPGAGTTVRIRGIGTMNNSDPLYVVDGFPMNDISFLAPTDIESMDILKDASASAIYGNRGANGVILITTRKGKSGATTVNFNAYRGVQNPINKLDLLNAHEYATLYLQAWTNDGKDVTDPDVMNPQNYAMLQYAIDNKLKGTDWQEEVTRRNAAIQNYSLDISGGTEKYRYRLSGTFFGQDGNVKNTYMDKYFAKLNQDIKFSERVRGGVITNYLRAKVGNYSSDQYSGVLPTAIGADPLTPAFDKDRDVNNWGNTQIFSQGNNPARIVDELKNQGWNQHKFVNNVWGEVDIIEGLSFRSSVGVDMNFNQSKYYYPRFEIKGSPESRLISQLDENRELNILWNWSNVLTYDTKFNDHALKFMLGQEAAENKFSRLSVSVRDVPKEVEQQYPSAAKNLEARVGSGQSEYALLSFFGRAIYSFKDRYVLTATGRYDGASKFVKANRWGFFPSFAASWNISNEPFMQDVPYVSLLKLRGGYGSVGNQGSVGNYDYVTTVGNDQRYSFAGIGVEGRIPTTLSNPELLWEESNMSNFALDFGFLDDRLTFTTEYFIRNTEKMIVRIPSPEYVGAYAPNANAGTMRNRGFEFNIQYRNSIGDFKYDLGFNAAMIRNELTYLGGGQPYEEGGINKVGNTVKVMEGQTFPFFYGFRTDGIFNSQEELDAYRNADGALIQPLASPGDVKFVDVDGNGIIDPNDRVNLGNPYPKATMGFTSDFQYKGFDLKMFFYASVGNKAVNSLVLWNEQPTGVLNSTRNRLSAWTESNSSSNEPRMTQADRNNNMRFSDRYVEDASFVRLRNVQLGYSLPQTMLTGVGLRSVRVYVSADNLWVKTKYKGFDPEFGALYGNPHFTGVDLANYPQAKTIIGGINVTF